MPAMLHEYDASGVLAWSTLRILIALHQSGEDAVKNLTWSTQLFFRAPISVEVEALVEMGSVFRERRRWRCADKRLRLNQQKAHHRNLNHDRAQLVAGKGSAIRPQNGKEKEGKWHVDIKECET